MTLRKLIQLRAEKYRIIKSGRGLKEIEALDFCPTEDDIAWEEYEPGVYLCQPIKRGKYKKAIWKHIVPGASIERENEPREPREKKRSALVNQERANELVEDMQGLAKVAAGMREVAIAFTGGGAPSNNALPTQPQTVTDVKKAVMNEMRESKQFLEDMAGFPNPYAPRRLSDKLVEKIADKTIDKLPWYVGLPMIGGEGMDPVKEWIKVGAEAIGPFLRGAPTNAAPPMILPRTIGPVSTPAPPPAPVAPPRPPPIVTPALSPAPVPPPQPAITQQPEPTSTPAPTDETLDVKTVTESELRAESKKKKFLGKKKQKKGTEQEEAIPA